MDALASALGGLRQKLSAILALDHGQQLLIPLNHQVAEQLQGCRLLVSFGDFWGTKMPEKLMDDPLEQDYVEYLYEWIDREYCLQGVRHVERK